MITLTVNAQGVVPVLEKLRSVVGSVNVERVKFEFDESWSGLTRFACFRNKVEFHVLLDDSNECNIPWEVLTNEGTLCVGALGMDGDTVVKPTLWVKYSDVFIGTDPEGAGTTEHTKSALEQMIQIQEETKQIAEDLQEAAESGEFDGKPGYTPVRGKDYWTSEDQQFIVDEATKQVGPLVDEAQTAAEDATAAKESIENMGVSAESVPYDEPAEVEKTIEEDAVNLHFKIPGGKTGNSGVHYGPDKPTDPDINVWIDPDGETDESYYNKTVAVAKRAESSAQSAQQASNDAKASSESAALSKTSAEEAAQSANTSASQATTAASNAQGFANSADTSKSAAEQAAREAQSAKSEASTSAQSASDSASAAEQAKIDAEAAASVIPKPTPEDAGKGLVVNPQGNGFIFGTVSGREWVLIRDETTEIPVLTFSESGLSDYEVIYFELESTMDGGGSIVRLFANDDLSAAYNISAEETQGTSNPYKLIYGFIFKGPDNSIQCMSHAQASTNSGSAMQGRGTCVYKRSRWSTTYPVEKITIKSFGNDFGVGSKIKIYASKEKL